VPAEPPENQQLRPAQETYVVHSWREGDWWIFEVDGIGATQAHDLHDGIEMVGEVILAVTGQHPGTDAVAQALRGLGGDTRRTQQDVSVARINTNRHLPQGQLPDS
jgi:hypothetical protein